jgi:diguanylate cyclase (GGDEF)-like protein
MLYQPISNFADPKYSTSESMRVGRGRTKKTLDILSRLSIQKFEKVNFFHKKRNGFLVSNELQNILTKFEIAIIIFELKENKIEKIIHHSSNLSEILDFTINTEFELERWFNKMFSNNWRELINNINSSFSLDLDNLKLIFDSETTQEKKKITLLIQQKQTNAKLLSIPDQTLTPITPVIPPSRNLFLNKIDVAFGQLKTAQIASLALFFIDINRFQVVNDSLGYNIGDTVLNQINKRLNENIDGNTATFHISGDEFGMLFQDFVGQEEVEELAKKIIIQFQKPFLINGKNIYISISLGVAIANDEYLLSEHILGDAHRAMRQAKAEKHSGWRIFNSQMKTKAESRLQLESDLRAGILNDEFKVYYQPIYDIQENTISRCECLIRWHSLTRGVVGPEQFLALAEETGMIIELDRLVFSKAVMQAKLWERKKIPQFQLSFNLSALQLKQKDLVEFVLQTLKSYSLDPSKIQFELTESLLIEDFQNSKSLISELQKNGISVAIDDFGTGYSSLSYLSNFNFQTLKMDKSFIDDITLEPNRQAIVKSIIEMTNSMNIKLIAEGVETLDQLEFLKTHGCREIQGFLISKPLDYKSLTKFFRLSNFVPTIDKNITKSLF